MITHYLATTLYSSGVITPPPPPPSNSGGVSLSLAKQHLEYEDDDRDALIQQYINAAKSWIENYTGKNLGVAAVTQTLDSFGSYIILDRAPFVSLTSVDYIDAQGAPQAVTGARLLNGRIYPPETGWPSVSDYTGVTVTYLAGYATVPADLMSAQLLLIGHYFQSREAVNVATSVTELPLAVESLCRPYRPLQV